MKALSSDVLVKKVHSHLKVWKSVQLCWHFFHDMHEVLVPLSYPPHATRVWLITERECCRLPLMTNIAEMKSRMIVYLEREKVGSCNLHLRGRLQRLRRQILQLSSNLRSESFYFSSILNVWLYDILKSAQIHSGPQSMVNGHIEVCHSTFTFLMGKAPHPPKEWVGECSSLSTRRCQNWWEIEATPSWCKSQTSFYGEVGFGICLKTFHFFKFFRGSDFLFGVWNSNFKSHISKEGYLRLIRQQSCFNLPPVWFQENLRQNNINRERVTVVNLRRKQMRGGGWRN